MMAHEIEKIEAFCIQEESAYCVAACPVHVDVRMLTSHIQKGDFLKALRAYERQVLFPGIISRICDEPCSEACLRRKLDDPIAVRLLEKACIDFAEATGGTVFASPRKSMRVAVIGGGLSGLSCALDLAKKGYRVTVFEQAGQLGGRLRNLDALVLPPAVISAECARVEAAGANVCLNMRIDDLSGLEYDAIFLATGMNGSTFDLLLDRDRKIQVDPVSLASSRGGVFAGGCLLESEGRYSPIACVSDGVRASRSIVRYLQKASMTSGRDEGSRATRLFTDIRTKESKPKIVAQDSLAGYSEDQAREEAARCLQCECLECVKACNFLKFYQEYPKQYVKHISKSLNAVPTMGTKFAARLINSCSLCGLCKEICPTGLDMGMACIEARRCMVEKGDMPPAFHDFLLRDMLFSNSEQAFLARPQPGRRTCAYLFFPGCQLGASSPEYVKKAYEYLTANLRGGVGLILGCCGAPAEWAGRQGLFMEQLKMLGDAWNEMGQPVVITACPTCHKIFRENLPAVEVQSFWKTVSENGRRPGYPAGDGKTVAVYDPCSSRYDPETQQSVRKILEESGYTVEELRLNGKYAQCCGYGGLIAAVNPDLADQIAYERINASRHPYVTYCINCRDHFAAKGKQVWYLLDLLFDGGNEAQASRKVASYSQKRQNRLRLKSDLLECLWSEKMKIEKQDYEMVDMIISPEILDKMEREMILLDEVKQVVHYAESTGNKMLDTENGHLTAHLQLGIITYWVEYLPREGAYEIINAYSHRMQIIQEGK